MHRAEARLSAYTLRVRSLRDIFSSRQGSFARHVDTFCFGTNRNTAPWHPERIGLPGPREYGMPPDLVSGIPGSRACAYPMNYCADLERPLVMNCRNSDVPPLPQAPSSRRWTRSCGLPCRDVWILRTVKLARKAIPYTKVHAREYLAPGTSLIQLYLDRY